MTTKLFQDLIVGQCFKTSEHGHFTFKKIDGSHYKEVKNLVGTKPSDEIKTMPENNLFDIVYPVSEV